MTSTRVRSLSGRSLRNTEVQICVSVSQFQDRVAQPSLGSIVFVSAIGILQFEDVRISGFEDLSSDSDPQIRSSAPHILISSTSELCLEKRLGIGPLPEL